jgi:acyl transferase domain-containing protein
VSRLVIKIHRNPVVSRVTANWNHSMLNKDGKSYSFDDRGSGYGRGEGIASLVIKRLDDAIAAGDPIRAVIRNTGVNQDGKTNGITLPNANSQESLSRQVYGQVSLDPRDTMYVEAHGTGTVVGDGIEVEAIRRVFCQNRESELYIGSIKANIGHLEPTSGLAAIIKAVLILENGLIPATPNILNVKTDLNLQKIKVSEAPNPYYKYCSCLPSLRYHVLTRRLLDTSENRRMAAWNSPKSVC